MPDGQDRSTFYSAVEVATLALQKVGSFSLDMTEPDEVQVYRALQWFDLEIAHLAGTGKCFWLMRDEVEVVLEDGINSYDLDSVAIDPDTGTALKLGIQFPKEAMLEDADGVRRDRDIPLVTQQEFRRHISRPTTTGEPRAIFIDRLNGPTMHVYPTPTDVEDGFKIILTVQTFANSVKPRGTTGDAGLGNRATGFPQAWNLWAVTRLASLIGDGPVVKLPAQTVALYTQQATGYLLALEAYQNRDHDNRPPIIRGSVYT